jgi:ornithine cyclodeaminase/alanine dehydrogenase-like protein (mu-crystallin family)
MARTYLRKQIMKVLSLEQTRAALPFDALINAIDEGFASGCTSPLRHHHFMQNKDGADDVLLLMPAWREQGWGGIKLVNVHPANSTKGLPAISSTYVLFDRETGQHRLILDGGELTARRTAAASALAAKRLARPDSKRLLVVGAGRVGSNIPHAYRAVLPIETVAVWNPTAANGQKLVSELNAQGIAAEFEPDLQAAVARADIVSCATLSREPIIKGEWLHPGQHIDLIGSFTPQMREADDEVMRRAKIYIDTEHAKVESGDIRTPLESGVIQDADILDTLEAMCRDNRYPRANENDITFFKGVGSAIEDLSAAILAAKIA